MSDKEARSKAARLMGKAGGAARARKLTKKRRSEIATNAVNARWAKRGKTS